jgi:protein involved in polysaccharide export with SLBB domain
MTDSTITLVVTNLVLVAGGLTKVIVDELRRRNDRLDRAQDRLDREQLAQLTSAQLESIRLAGDRRVKTVVDEVVKTRQVAIKAFKEANGVNQKIESLGLKLTENNPPPTL